MIWWCENLWIRRTVVWEREGTNKGKLPIEKRMEKIRDKNAKVLFVSCFSSVLIDILILKNLNLSVTSSHNKEFWLNTSQTKQTKELHQRLPASLIIEEHFNLTQIFVRHCQKFNTSGKYSVSVQTVLVRCWTLWLFCKMKCVVLFNCSAVLTLSVIPPRV